MSARDIHAGYVPGIFGRLTELHATYYGERWGLGAQFEADIASGLAEFAAAFDPERDGLWSVLGPEGSVHGGIVIDGRAGDEDEAQLRYFILDPMLHGVGYGRGLLERAVDFCDDAGYDRVFLWTVDDLEAAIHLYRAFGFSATETIEAHTEWETDVRYRLFERRPA